ncbi:hypothetical protein MN116_004303 [Schistosoma mekongi]|uniref:RILP-like protein n=1 Tax=Schistosoma mekongi TaxID=38744 RepID=A0AAE1ZFQ7_SCHME|nr:hypothetical protein MN116_004303 [Schistosoma mekongi]
MFTTMDVYDAALSIGRECQLIVDEYGDGVLRDLMPKIVYILEELETCTSYSDKEKEEIARLQTVADELREDQKSDILLKDKYDKSLEQLEQSWYCESQKLLKEIAELEEENVRLTHQLISSCHKEIRDEKNNEDFGVLQKCAMCTECPSECSTKTISHSKVGAFLLATAKLDLEGALANHEVNENYENLKNKSSEELSVLMSSLLLETDEKIHLTEQENRSADLQLVQQLKECVAINYKTARQIRRELAEVSASLDASEEEVCRLARQSGQLMASRAPHRRQTGQLVAEKATLETQLCVKERELANLLKDLSAQDISQSDGSGIMTDAGESILHLSAGQGLESLPTVLTSNTLEKASINDHISMEELRYLLHERNELKCRLIELGEELKVLELENQRDPDVEGPMWPEPPEKLRPTVKEHPNIKTVFQNLLHRLTERTTTILL